MLARSFRVLAEEIFRLNEENREAASSTLGTQDVHCRAKDGEAEVLAEPFFAVEVETEGSVL